MKILLVLLLLFGCENKEKKWTSLLSSKAWYNDIKSKEKRFTGKIYDKGITKWIVKEDFEKSIVKDEVLFYKKGEEYNRFLFETGFVIYDINLFDLWGEERMIDFLLLNNPKEAKKLSNKKFEIIGKERIVFIEEGGKKIKRREIIPKMIREK